MIQKIDLKDSLNICKMEQEHIKQVVDIEKECFSEAWTEQNYIDEMNKNDSYIWVASVGEEVVGHAGMYIVLQEGYVMNIAVKKGYRRLGIGKALMNKIESYAKEKQLKFISLEVRKSNNNAILFYEKMGYEVCGERKNFYKYPTEDAFIMTKYFYGSSGEVID